MIVNEKKGFLKTAGANIYFESKGIGESLLFIHAGIADCRMWEREFYSLAEHFHVIRFDLPGYGLSEFTGGSFSYIHIINALLEYLNISKVHILATSFGGKIAIDFALANQDKCLSLALGAPAISGWKDSQYLQDYEAEEKRLFKEATLEEVANYNFDMWILQKRHPNSIDSSIKDLVIDMQMKSFTKPEPNYPCEEIEEEENLSRIANIKIPVLIIIGDQDVEDFQKIADYICCEISSANKVIIKNAAHLVNLEYPILFEKIISNFFISHI